MIIERILIFLLFIIGFAAIVAMPNIIKKIFGLNLMNAAVVLLFILEGSRIGDQAPILGDGVKHIVDPIPQALMLTAIVIGVCISALALALAVRLYKATGSLDINVITKRLESEH
ncbi:MAG: sodium:proton antiporter [Sphaerochaeta sp.]|uniref:sodium:proton antiporter n=1 Tax=unclassified Sphaerochaeta TaxID=2637943 RepID=UPI0025D5A9F2|nr:sodium:proton antiporter [Sphaerochaeta sp. UBA5856]MEA4864435.1 sodium:proton antiporter [Sphaerochaeta sp.]